MSGYIPFYCEENVWRLLSGPRIGRAWAVLMFGRHSAFAMFRQRAGRSGDGLVFWDYHAVALAAASEGSPAILDYDSDLGFRNTAEAYLESSFSGIDAAGEFAPLFRVVDAGDYVGRLFSDRSHMLDAAGSYIAPPPPWAPPGAELPAADRWPLAELIDPRQADPPSIMDLPKLRRFIGTIA